MYPKAPYKACSPIGPYYDEIVFKGCVLVIDPKPLK